MADGARIDGGSGIWKLTSRAPRTPSTFGCCRTTVAMATPRSPRQGGLRTRPLGTSSGELTDPPWRPGPDVSRCRSRSSRGTHSLLDSAVRECGESRVAPVQRASFRHYGRPTSPRVLHPCQARRQALGRRSCVDQASSKAEDGPQTSHRGVQSDQSHQMMRECPLPIHHGAAEKGNGRRHHLLDSFVRRHAHDIDERPTRGMITTPKPSGKPVTGQTRDGSRSDHSAGGMFWLIRKRLPGS